MKRAFLSALLLCSQHALSQTGLPEEPQVIGPPATAPQYLVCPPRTFNVVNGKCSVPIGSPRTGVVRLIEPELRFASDLGSAPQWRVLACRYPTVGLHNQNCARRNGSSETGTVRLESPTLLDLDEVLELQRWQVLTCPAAALRVKDGQCQGNDLQWDISLASGQDDPVKFPVDPVIGTGVYSPSIPEPALPVGQCGFRRQLTLDKTVSSNKYVVSIDSVPNSACTPADIAKQQSRIYQIVKVTQKMCFLELNASNGLGGSMIIRDNRSQLPPDPYVPSCPPSRGEIDTYENIGNGTSATWRQTHD
jgi:hypothetical protein